MTAKDQIELADSGYKIKQNKAQVPMILMATAVF